MSEQSYKLIGVESAYGLSIPQTPRKPETFYRWRFNEYQITEWKSCDEFWIAMMEATYTLKELDGLEIAYLD